MLVEEVVLGQKVVRNQKVLQVHCELGELEVVGN